MAGVSSRREQPQVYPLPQSFNSNTAYNVKRDEESASTMESDELPRKKRIKYLAYFSAFVVFRLGL